MSTSRCLATSPTSHNGRAHAGNHATDHTP